MGAEIAHEIERASRSAAEMNQRIEQEWIQDQVVDLLKKRGQQELAEHYQAYRDERARARNAEQDHRKQEKPIRLSVNDAEVKIFGKQDWIEGLARALKAGAGSEWTPQAWWSECEEEALGAKTYHDFVAVFLRALLERVNGRAAWLTTASWMVMDRWCVKELGLGPLLSDIKDVEKAAQHKWKGSMLKMKPELAKLGWGPNAKEVDALISPWSIERCFQWPVEGLLMLEEVGSKNGELPTEMLGRVAVSMGARMPGNHLKKSEETLRALMERRLLAPLGALSAGTSLMWGQERLVAISDDVGSIFEALKRTAELGKEGASAAIDLTPLRASGAEVGKSGGQSQGIRPVLALFGEACGMLRGVRGEKQKARLFLDCWHSELEIFMSYGKVAPKEVRLGVRISDAFMKRVIEGGDWLQASPVDVPHLIHNRGEEFERWVRDYIQMAKFGGLGKAKSVPARTVFGWICESIASSGSPSIMFEDACRDFERPMQRALMTARMCGVGAEGDGGFVEWGIRPEGLGAQDGAELLNLACDISRAIQAKDPNLSRIMISPVGSVSADEMAQMIQLAGRDAVSGERDKKKQDSWWRDFNPWKRRRELMLAERGGLLEICKTGLPEGHSEWAWRTGLLGVSSREEYLWMGGCGPVFVDADEYRRQVRFQGVKASGGGGGKSHVKKQIKRAAEWQAICDQGMTWDANLTDGVEPGAVGETIKWAWLHGLTGIRRFMGPTAEENIQKD